MLRGIPPGEEPTSSAYKFGANCEESWEADHGPCHVTLELNQARDFLILGKVS